MPVIETQRNITNLIKITNVGLDIASFNEIKEVLANKYKEIYGKDIDLSNTTADGIYLQNISLIISNILQSFRFLYNNTDIRTAQGTYLESLCALTGIYRKGASQSLAYLSITNNEETTIVLQGGTSGTQLSFIDKSGLIWKTYIGDITHSSPTLQISLEPGIAQSVPVYCELYGAVSAKKGWIDTLVTNDYNITFEQIDDAIMGNNTESDAELRRRRNENISSSGLTVLQSLKGSLMNIGGIQDVKIYNNNNGEQIIALDGTIVNSGNVYIIIKQNQEIDDELIGNLIYNKMTPGVKTCVSSGICGINHEFVYDESSVFINKVNWKRVININSNLKVNVSLIKLNNFDINTFCDNLRAYFNNLKIGQTFTSYEMLSDLSSADVNRTCVINNISISNIETQNDNLIINQLSDYTEYTAKDTCFNLSNNYIVTDISDTQIEITWL